MVALLPQPLSQLADREVCLLRGCRYPVPRCLVYSNFPEVNPAFGAHHLQHLYVPRVAALSGVVLAKLPASTGLVVAGDDGFLPVVDRRAIVAEQIPPHWSLAQVEEAVARAGSGTEIDHRAILIGRFGIRTWGHWLGELLPKVVCAEYFAPKQFQYVLPASVTEDPHFRNVMASLAHYGVGPERLTTLSNGRPYRFAELWCVSSVWSDHMLHPEVGELMRWSVRPSARDVAECPDAISLLRTEDQTRNVANAEEIAACLGDAGFTAVEIGRLPFWKQVRTFAAARSVVGVLGSGLTGLIYAQPGVQVVTLAPGGWSDRFFFGIMQTRSAILADIRGPTLPNETRGPAAAKFEIDRHQLRHGLDAVAMAAGGAPESTAPAARAAPR